MKAMKARLKDLETEVTEIKKELKDQNSRLAETNRHVQWLMENFPKHKEENSRSAEAKVQTSKSTTETTDEEVDACWTLTHLSDSKFDKIEGVIDSESEVCHLLDELLQVSGRSEKVGEPEKSLGDSGNLDEALKMIDEAEELMKIMEDETSNSS